MGWQENLTEENVEELEEKLREMQEKNSDLNFGFFEQKGKIESPSNREVIERIDKLERKIDLIFGNYVLIEGKFIQP